MGREDSVSGVSSVMSWGWNANRQSIGKEYFLVFQPARSAGGAMPVINFRAGSGAGPARLPWVCAGAGASRRRLEAGSRLQRFLSYHPGQSAHELPLIR